MIDTIQNYTDKDMSVTITEFRNDMGTNPLARSNSQILKILGSCYIVEYYSDTIAGKRLNIWRKALEKEDHYRKWIGIAETSDFDDDIRKEFEEITAKTCKQFDPMIE